MASKRLPPVQHEVAIESAGPSLAALFAATILSKGSCAKCSINDLILSLIEHILGRKGSQPPSKAASATCNTLQRYLDTGKIAGKNKLEIVNDCNTLATLANTSIFCGNIIKDWKQVVEWLGNCSSVYSQKLAYDVQYLRLLQRGSQLFASLDGLWRRTHTYEGAVEAVDTALTQEHFALSSRKWTGVNVMTIHKSKGKEFDVVIIYEGKYQNRIVSRPDRIDQARINLRVAVTRAKQQTIIMTPEDNPCLLL